MTASADMGELLHCPLRGNVLAYEKAADGLRYTEEKRRIDCIRFLLSKGYPIAHIKVETTLLRFGNKGRNSFRTDIAVLDAPVSTLPSDIEALKPHIRLIAEIKRDNAEAVLAKQTQVYPALGFIPNIAALGIYWDDIEQRLFYRSIKGTQTAIHETSAALLPRWGLSLGKTNLKQGDLQVTNVLALFDKIEDTLHSEMADESQRFEVMLQLLLLKLHDEHTHRLPTQEMDLQDYADAPMGDADVVKAFERMLGKAVAFYGRYLPREVAKKFEITGGMLRRISALLAPISVLNAKREVIQDFYMYFAKGVYKWDLGQYFTPTEVVDFIVSLVNPQAGDQIKDPACGSGDFLISALHSGRRNEIDLSDAIWGSDNSKNAVQVCVLNMVLNGDGKNNIKKENSLEVVADDTDTYSAVLCNPPFGVMIVESRFEVLRQFDLGHDWEVVKEDEEGGEAVEETINKSTNQQINKTDKVRDSQQTGLLFAELCVRQARAGGRIGIILPNGYLGNGNNIYLAFREWILRHTRLVAVVAFPRFTFKKSGADVSASVVILEKRDKPLASARESERYPVHFGMIESVGWSVGDKGGERIFRRDPMTGAYVCNKANERIIDADFDRALAAYLGSKTADVFPWMVEGRERGSSGWSINISEVLARSDLSIDPKRWCERVARVRKAIGKIDHFALGDVAEVVPVVGRPTDKSKLYRYVPIEATADGVAMPESLRGWQLPDRGRHRASPGEIFVGKIWSSVSKWFVSGRDCDDVVVTNGFHRLRLKKGKNKYLLDIVAGLNTEAYRVQARAYCTGSDGLADLAEENLVEIVLPIVANKTTRATLQPMIDALLAGRSTVASVISGLQEDGGLPKIDVPARSSHVVQV